MNETGKTYGALTVLSCEGVGEHAQCVFQCACGQTVRTRLAYVRRGQRKSCGCLKRQLLQKRNSVHGMRSCPEYQVWARIKACCFRKTHARFRDYGGRGIKLCERWMNFENFIIDMGHRPTANHSIDRTDNNGHYEPKNCRWVLAKEQSRNRRDNVILGYNGVSMCLNAWAEKLGVPRERIRERLKRGWSVEKTLSSPAVPIGKYNRKGKRKNGQVLA